jgi:hypothetical protein
MICQNSIPGFCSLPPTPPLNLTGWFSKPKPNPLPPPKKPSGQRVKVLHLSDFHIDPRASQRFFLIPLLCPLGTEPRLASDRSFISVYYPNGYHLCILYSTFPGPRVAWCTPRTIHFLPFYPTPVLSLRMSLDMYCRLRDGRRGKLHFGLVLSREYLQLN